MQFLGTVMESQTDNRSDKDIEGGDDETEGEPEMDTGVEMEAQRCNFLYHKSLKQKGDQRREKERLRVEG